MKQKKSLSFIQFLKKRRRFSPKLLFLFIFTIPTVLFFLIVYNLFTPQIILGSINLKLNRSLKSLMMDFGIYGNSKGVTKLTGLENGWRTGIHNSEIPGEINIVFKESMSVTDIKKFIREILVRKYSLSEEPLDEYIEDGFKQSPSDTTQYRTVYYRFIELNLDANQEKINADAFNILQQMTNLHIQLSSDDRIESFYDPEPSIAGLRIYAIKLNKGINDINFLKSYPHLIKVPKNITVVGRNQKEDQLYSIGNLYIFHTLRDDFERIALLSDEVSVKYSDLSKTFTFVFPESYSLNQIKESMKKLNINFKRRYGDFEYGHNLRFRFKVPIGDEQFWIDELSSYPEAEEVYQAKTNYIQ